MGPLSAADSKPLQEKEKHPLHTLQLGRGYGVALQSGPIAAALTPGSCSFKSQCRTVGYCSPCGDAPRPLGGLPVEAVRPGHQLARDIPEVQHKAPSVDQRVDQWVDFRAPNKAQVHSTAVTPSTETLVKRRPSVQIR